jgi:acyl carrier protein
MRLDLVPRQYYDLRHLRLIHSVGEPLDPEAGLSTLAPDADLRETSSIDSFDHLSVLIGLHEALGVEIPEADYGQLTTLTQIILYLAARVA